MAIPKQVAEKAKEADEMLEAMKKAQAGESDQKPEETPAENPDEKAEPKPEEQPPDEPKEEPDDLAAKLAKSEHRVSVIQGMLDTANREKRTLERDLNAEIVDRDRQLKELSARIESLENSAKEPPKVSASDVFSKDELAMFDEQGLSQEVVDVFAQKITNIASQQGQAVQDQLNEKVKTIEEKAETLTNDQIVHRQNTFFADLAKAHPDWEKANVDPRWNEWLRVRVPGTNYTRQDIIDHSQNSLNAKPINDLLSDWKKEVGWGKKKNPLEDKVEQISSSPHVSATPSTDTGRLYKASEIKQFYADATKKGTSYLDPDAYAKMDQEYMKATIEGRVIEG